MIVQLSCPSELVPPLILLIVQPSCLNHTGMLDFVPMRTTLSFSPADTELTVTIEINSDDIIESVGNTGELFLVRLTTMDNPIQVDLTENIATVTIVDVPGIYV